MSGHMDWQQKAAALDALEEIRLHIVKPGRWLLLQSVGICDGATATSKSASGNTPQDAVEERWDQLSSVQFPSFLIARYGQDDERRVIWNGFMWADIPRADRAKARPTPEARTIRAIDPASVKPEGETDADHG